MWTLLRKKACTGAAVLYPARPGRAQSGPYAHDSLESIRRSAIGPAFLYKKKRAVVLPIPGAGLSGLLRLYALPRRAWLVDAFS